MHHIAIHPTVTYATLLCLLQPHVLPTLLQPQHQHPNDMTTTTTTTTMIHNHYNTQSLQQTMPITTANHNHYDTATTQPLPPLPLLYDAMITTVVLWHYVTVVVLAFGPLAIVCILRPQWAFGN